MRNKIVLAFFTAVISSTAFAQQEQSVSSCTDKVMHAELVSLDKSFEQQGFSVIMFNSMSMPSGSYVPVQLNMEQGKMYQINFLASKDFQQYNLTLIDKDRKKLINKKVKQGGSNRLSESFAAPYTGNYIIVLSQKVKGQPEACGGISILKSK
ncbi:hypothetical protein [Taibaiella chishuiensis]|uniref:Gliding motility-associated-like protein n=1 Tax=Taibaiella chishuiensis TaxID=1434707 RepID=A0A2P8DD47_9BACT|nr:hypothetical protein [Taibaiella chishuiensis]PSK95129.1 hypothetical protein B0I18_1011293 [Taibaiella chishuiensis]